MRRIFLELIFLFLFSLLFFAKAKNSDVSASSDELELEPHRFAAAAHSKEGTTLEINIAKRPETTLEINLAKKEDSSETAENLDHAKDLISLKALEQPFRISENEQKKTTLEINIGNSQSQPSVQTNMMSETDQEDFAHAKDFIALKAVQQPADTKKKNLKIEGNAQDQDSQALGSELDTHELGAEQNFVHAREFMSLNALEKPATAPKITNPLWQDQESHFMSLSSRTGTDQSSLQRVSPQISTQNDRFVVLPERPQQLVSDSVNRAPIQPYSEANLYPKGVAQQAPVLASSSKNAPLLSNQEANFMGFAEKENQFKAPVTQQVAPMLSGQAATVTSAVSKEKKIKGKKALAAKEANLAPSTADERATFAQASNFMGFSEKTDSSLHPTAEEMASFAQASHFMGFSEKTETEQHNNIVANSKSEVVGGANPGTKQDAVDDATLAAEVNELERLKELLTFNTVRGVANTDNRILPPLEMEQWEDQTKNLMSLKAARPVQPDVPIASNPFLPDQETHFLALAARGNSPQTLSGSPAIEAKVLAKPEVYLATDLLQSNTGGASTSPKDTAIKDQVGSFTNLMAVQSPEENVRVSKAAIPLLQDHAAKVTNPLWQDQASNLMSLAAREDSPQSTPAGSIKDNMDSTMKEQIGSFINLLEVQGAPVKLADHAAKVTNPLWQDQASNLMSLAAKEDSPQSISGASEAKLSAGSEVSKNLLQLHSVVGASKDDIDPVLKEQLGSVMNLLVSVPSSAVAVPSHPAISVPSTSAVAVASHPVISVPSTSTQAGASTALLGLAEVPSHSDVAVHISGALQPGMVAANPETSGVVQVPSAAGVMQVPSSAGAVQVPSAAGAIQVPSSSAVHVASAAGAVQVPSSAGAIQVPSSSGVISVPSAAGAIKVVSSAGAIQVPSSGAVQVPSQAGGVIVVSSKAESAPAPAPVPEKVRRTGSQFECGLEDPDVEPHTFEIENQYIGTSWNARISPSRKEKVILALDPGEFGVAEVGSDINRRFGVPCGRINITFTIDIEAPCPERAGGGFGFGFTNSEDCLDLFNVAEDDRSIECDGFYFSTIAHKRRETTSIFVDTQYESRTDDLVFQDRVSVIDFQLFEEWGQKVVRLLINGKDEFHKTFPVTVDASINNFKFSAATGGCPQKYAISQLSISTRRADYALVPTRSPTRVPTRSPTNAPTESPTSGPTKSPTKTPTRKPTKSPTKKPTKKPTRKPTKMPTGSPTASPTRAYNCTDGKALPPNKLSKFEIESNHLYMELDAHPDSKLFSSSITLAEGPGSYGVAHIPPELSHRLGFLCFDVNITFELTLDVSMDCEQELFTGFGFSYGSKNKCLDLFNRVEDDGPSCDGISLAMVSHKLRDSTAFYVGDKITGRTNRVLVQGRTVEVTAMFSQTKKRKQVGFLFNGKDEFFEVFPFNDPQGALDNLRFFALNGECDQKYTISKLSFSTNKEVSGFDLDVVNYYVPKSNYNKGGTFSALGLILPEDQYKSLMSTTNLMGLAAQQKVKSLAAHFYSIGVVGMMSAMVVILGILSYTRRPPQHYMPL